MQEITLEKLIELVNSYNPDEKDRVIKAYNYAEKLHQGQKRQSGEQYIIHPLSVAYILAQMHADGDTLCAGLLHDTIEDTGITKEDVAKEFNKTVANLVDGVTKISGLKYSTLTKSELNLVNTRKIIMSINEDVRIIIIKLADRLHNMRTLQYKSRFKQQENALETMDIFVPIAYYIGYYQIKSELEDLSFKYLKPEIYQEYSAKRKKYEKDYEECLQEMLFNIRRILNDNDVPHEIKCRTKNIYGIYKSRHRKGDIHDLFAIKILVDNEINCYNALRLVHKAYHPVNSYFKDFICNPKTNMYQSLHSTVFGPNNKLVQTQFRTFEMDKVATYGITSYWDIKHGGAGVAMQEELREKHQFFESLLELDELCKDNLEFLTQVKNEIFTDNVYVYTSDGEVKQFPKGSTVIDFAYRIHTDVGNTMVYAVVNDERVDIDYVLKSNDRVWILTDEKSPGPAISWLNIAQTSYARRRIKDFIKR